MTQGQFGHFVNFLFSSFSKRTRWIVAISLVVVVGTVIFLKKEHAVSIHTAPFAKHVFREIDQQDNAKDPITTLQATTGPKIVVLWGLSCLPCIKMLKTLNTLAPELKESNVEVIPICVTRDPQNKKVAWASIVYFFARIAAETMTWRKIFPQLQPYYDQHGNIYDAAKPTVFPTLLFIDANGTVVGRLEGQQAWDTSEGKQDLEDWLQKIGAKGA